MKTAHDLVTAAKALVQEVPLNQADEAIRTADVLIDVREADEYQAGHIPGAIHASRGVLEFRLSSTPELSARDLKVVLYCKTSGRAALAARAMQDMGYLQVQSIAGGFDAWVAAAHFAFTALVQAGPIPGPQPLSKELIMNINVGTADRVLRVLAGLVLIALAATGTVGWWGWLGVVPLATGLFRFCPAYTLLGINTCPVKK
eukprot:gene8748-8839_t